MTLLEVTGWLQNVEDLACSVYSEAAGSVGLTAEIAEFLGRLAEDEALHYNLMGRAFERGKQNEALDQIRKNFFNVVLTDVDMPVRDGLYLLRKAIYEYYVWRSHFIVCTGNAMEGVRKITDEYAFLLLEKPISLQLLWKTVEDVLSSGSSA